MIRKASTRPPRRRPPRCTGTSCRSRSTRPAGANASNAAAKKSPPTDSYARSIPRGNSRLEHVLERSFVVDHAVHAQAAQEVHLGAAAARGDQDVAREFGELRGDLPGAARRRGDQNRLASLSLFPTLRLSRRTGAADAGKGTPPACSRASDAVSPEVSSASIRGDASGTDTTSFASATAYSLNPRTSWSPRARRGRAPGAIASRPRRAPPRFRRIRTRRRTGAWRRLSRRRRSTCRR